MTTIHEKTLKDLVNRRMAEDQEWCSVLSQALQRLEEGFYVQEEVDVILQQWPGHSYDIYDAYAVLQVRAAIRGGQIGTAKVKLGATPRADSEVAYHNRILADSPDAIFSGHFYGGLADQDGEFAWKRSIDLTVQSYDAATNALLEATCVPIDARSVPLEVGYTKGSRTLLHLVHEPGLARWPYESASLHILVVLDPSLWTVSDVQ